MNINLLEGKKKKQKQKQKTNNIIILYEGIG